MGSLHRSLLLLLACCGLGLVHCKRYFIIRHSGSTDLLILDYSQDMTDNAINVLIVDQDNQAIFSFSSATSSTGFLSCEAYALLKVSSSLQFECITNTGTSIFATVTGAYPSGFAGFLDGMAVVVETSRPIEDVVGLAFFFDTEVGIHKLEPLASITVINEFSVGKITI